MKAMLGAFTAVLLARAIYAQPAHAQPIPQGSYINSCRHVGMEGNRLLADCRRMDGGWQRTVLDVDRCVGDISNYNGRLICNRAPREGYGSGRYGSSGGCAWIANPYERERCFRGH
jgi:CVNH domain